MVAGLLAVFYIWIGFFVGVFVYAQMILPLIYALPRAVYLTAKGKLRPVGILAALVAPCVWFCLLAVFGLVTSLFVTPLYIFATTNTWFGFGTILGLLKLLFNFLSQKGRADMHADFMDTIFKRYQRQSRPSALSSAAEKWLAKDYQGSLAELDMLLDGAQEGRSREAHWYGAALSMRAHCLSATGYLLDALDDYIDAIEVDPAGAKDGNLHGLCGCLYFQVGEIGKAKKHLALAIQRGMKMYQSQLDIANSFAGPELEQSLRENARKEGKLKRRDLVRAS